MKSIRKLLVGLGVFVVIYLVGYGIYRSSRISASSALGFLDSLSATKSLVIPKTSAHNLAYYFWLPLIGADKEISGVQVLRLTREETEGLDKLDGVIEIFEKK